LIILHASRTLALFFSLTVRLFPAVNLNHFKLLRVVGKGAFGKVRIVERKDTGLTFALKYIRKDEGQWRSEFLNCID
jgi:serine/threonine protein kinase